MSLLKIKLFTLGLGWLSTGPYRSGPVFRIHEELSASTDLSNYLCYSQSDSSNSILEK